MRWSRGVLAVAVAAATLAAGAAGAQAAPTTATFTKTSDWGSGFVANYVIRNGATTPIVGWRLELDLPLGAALTSAWSAKLSAIGTHAVLTDESWTRTIPAGGSVQIGFQGVAGGPFPGPASCTLNGQPCSGGTTPPPPPPDTTPPTVPSGLAVVGTPGQSSATLSWAASSDAVGVAGYRVLRDGVQVAQTTATTVGFSDLTAGTTYRFTVRAYDAAGNVSADSAPLTVTTASPPPPPPGGTLTATFTKESDWGSGFVASVVIANGSSAAVDGWTLQLQLPAGTQITSAWSAVLTGSGTVATFTPEAWTRTIPAGGSVKLGFQGTANGPFPGPAGCVLNGRACGDGAPPDTTAPAAPTGLTVDAVTAGSVALRWTAATDDRGVTAYDVYRGGEKVLTTADTSAVAGGLQPNTAYTFTVKARDAAGNVSLASTAATATTLRDTSAVNATPPGYAPYVDMTLWPQFPLAASATTPGLRQATLGFVVSGAPCQATWGTYYGLDDPWFRDQIAGFRAAGGTPIVSFGGAANQELALTCPTVSALAAQYQAVIDATGSRDLDFDIEGAATSDAASLARRAQAIAQLQGAGAAAGRPVRVSFTLPVMPTGLDANGLRVLRAAIDNGVDVGTVNVMAMDYYDPSLNVAGHMGDLAVQAATSLHDQLAQLYPARSDARLWQMVGVTPMIGINDNPAEIFTVADAAKLVAFANQKHLGRLAIWSANRDVACPGPRTYTENTCSGTAQTPWQFSTTLGGFPATT